MLGFDRLQHRFTFELQFTSIGRSIGQMPQIVLNVLLQHALSKEILTLLKRGCRHLTEQLQLLRQAKPLVHLIPFNASG